MALLTASLIKTGINLKEVADIQTTVNKVFEYTESNTERPFQEFHEKDAKERNEVLQMLAKVCKEKGLKGAVDLALEFQDKKKRNPALVQSAFSIFLTHDKQARNKHVVVPPLALQGKFIRKLRPYANPVSRDTFQGGDTISYFREDYDLNDHHNHWHAVYPHGGIPGGSGGLKRTIRRQGELFLYMHTQMLARYNAELLAWDLDGLHAFSYDDVLMFGYLPPPGLQHQYSSRPAYRGWFENQNPHIPNDPPPPKSDLIEYRKNILKAMEDGYFSTTGAEEKYFVNEANMMNTVGVVVEAESPELQEVKEGVFINRELYGSLHNNGHMKFAAIGYTEQKPQYGVMGDTQTAVRDHVFWLWHRHVDEFHNAIVKMYTHDLETFKPEAEIIDLEIVPQDLSSETPQGGLATYLCPPNLERNEVHAKLRHEPYKWKIIVNSTRATDPTDDNPQVFTVRLFITLKTLIQDHRSWIEMDKFTVQLKKRRDTITRLDVDSAVARKVNLLGSDSRCSCGWPQNLMLPAGKPEGTPYAAFAILTTGELGEDSETQSLSFCGVEDGDYPDPRGMGYPFNKTWKSRVDSTTSVESIIDNLSHTKLSYFTIYRYTKPYEDEETKKGDLVVTFKNWMNALLG